MPGVVFDDEMMDRFCNGAAHDVAAHYEFPLSLRLGGEATRTLLNSEEFVAALMAWRATVARSGTAQTRTKLESCTRQPKGRYRVDVAVLHMDEAGDVIDTRHVTLCLAFHDKAPKVRRILCRNIENAAPEQA